MPKKMPRSVGHQGHLIGGVRETLNELRNVVQLAVFLLTVGYIGWYPVLFECVPIDVHVLFGGCQYQKISWLCTTLHPNKKKYPL